MDGSVDRDIHYTLYTVLRTPYAVATSECRSQGLGDVSGSGGVGTGSWKFRTW